MPGRSQRADAAQNVSRLLLVARQVFARSGGPVSLNDIAAEAEVGIATLYRHFASRDALARAVYAEIFATDIQPLLAQFLASDAPRPLLQAAVETFSRLLETDAALMRSIDDLARATRQLFEPALDAIEATLVRARAAGHMRADVVAEDVANLFAVVVAAFASHSWAPGARRRYVGLILDGLNPAAVEPLAPLG